MTWQGIIYVPQVYDSGTLSYTLYIPIYPFVGVVAFGLALYSVVLLIHFWEFISEAKSE